MPKRAAGIGIFDSGVGGLTVMRSIAERLPSEDLIYLGDTARVPYGTKSSDTVTRYAHACSRILVKHDVKLIVVACNTASAFALGDLQETFEIPVIGVIEPGARAAVERTRNNRIGVLGTAGTIRSGKYQDCIQGIEPSAQVFTQACPLFVPLAEEGWTRGEVPMAVATEYLKPLIECEIDTLLLGCTHYPLLREVIEKVVGDSITIVDSAQATASTVEETLAAIGNMAETNGSPLYRHLVSDDPESFRRIGKHFLARELDHIDWVDF